MLICLSYIFFFGKEVQFHCFCYSCSELFPLNIHGIYQNYVNSFDIQDYGSAGRMDTNDSLRVASLWHSMHAISQQLSPVSGCSGIELLQADTFDLHCFQSLTGIFSEYHQPLSHYFVNFLVYLVIKMKSECHHSHMVDWNIWYQLLQFSLTRMRPCKQLYCTSVVWFQLKMILVVLAYQKLQIIVCHIIIAYLRCLFETWTSLLWDFTYRITMLS